VSAGNINLGPGTGDAVFGGEAGDTLIILNVEMFPGLSIAQVRGSAPIVTEGVAVTNTLVTDVYDSLNNDDTEGAYYLEVDMGLAANVLDGFLSTVGANFQLSDGTTQVTQPWTAGTYQKVGIAYGSSLMAINVDGIWSADVAYDGTLLSGALDLFRTPAGAATQRNVQRYAQDFTTAKTTIDGLMA
jgi:hypothetical protein